MPAKRSPNLDTAGRCNDSFAPDARSVGFKVPPEELPTIRSLLPLAKPQISSLIADSHGPSSGDYCTGDELKAACWDRWNVRLASPLMPENFDVARANRERQQVFCSKEDMGPVIISNPQSYPQSMMSCTTFDTVEVCGSSPHGPTISFSELGSTTSFGKAPNGSIKDAVHGQ